jgi:DNA-binding transcriptional MerR regulator/methylmalonyl-CoA mutase cobalamin-binding subunit
MAAERGALRAAHNAKLTIGALSRATGIAVETLRTWERRYGFPLAERKPSGHRLYDLSAVTRLRRIAEALARGHRAAEVVPAADADLDTLLSMRSADPTPSTAVDQLAASTAEAPPEMEDLLRAVESFDAERLTHLLLIDWARLGPIPYLTTRIAPLVHAVGEGWAQRRLEIRHEHFLSERVGDMLRALRIPYEDRARGPRIVLATLPGEEHGLGLQMAALILASAGWRLLFLGTEVPVTQIAAVADERKAGAVGLSVSVAAQGPATQTRIRRLRQALPSRVKLVIGGEGARGVRGVDVVRDLAALDSWARNRLDPT